MKPRGPASIASIASLLVIATGCSGGGGSGASGIASALAVPVAPGTSSSVGATASGSSSSGASSGQAQPGAAVAAAAVTITTPQGVAQGDVLVAYKLIDAGSKAFDIAVDFSLDQGQTWAIARPGKGGDGVRALASAAAPGKDHVFSWDSLLDVGQKLAPDVRLRITPTGAIGAASGRFAVDNAPLNTSVSVTRGPYVQSTTTTSTIVVWKTAQPADSVVEFGDTAQLGRTAGNAQASETTHAVTLTGLSAGKRYTYRIAGAGGPVTTREELLTAPDATAAGFKFLVFGDSGTGSQEQMDLAPKMAAEDFDMMLHMGDVIYPMGAAGDYDPKFFKPYAPMLRRRCIFPAIGNHDLLTLGIGYKQAFYMTANNPSGSKFYYSFEWGDAKFISIDTTMYFHMPFGKHMTWLQNELASNTKTWLIVYMHIPLYSSGAHGEDKILQTILGPMLENAKVSLVLQGHDHNYERTNPIKKYNNDPNFKGIPYIVSGGAGASTRGVTPHSYTAKGEAAYHYVLCEIAGRTLTGTAKRLDGSVLDTFTVQAR